jgi:hypothetical protein
MKMLIRRGMNRYSGEGDSAELAEDRNPELFKDQKPWMPDQVRHDGKLTTPKLSWVLFSN